MTMSFVDLEKRAAEGKAAPVVVEAAPQPETLKTRRGWLYRSVIKRSIDVGAILLAVPVVVPIVAGLAIVVWAEGGRPFYSQDRVGRGGKTFRMWKLRSMEHDADALMDEYLAANPDAQEEWSRTQKLANDPRVTRFGQFMRKSSLDELPQLWNVLKGDMSLVGPRPMMTSQKDLYHGQAYYELRPGITGYWQTSERNRTTFEARADYDAAYERDVSLATDLRLLVKTVSVVVKGTGC